MKTKKIDYRQNFRLAQFVASISTQGLDREPTEDEIWMLFEAARKSGSPPF